MYKCKCCGRRMKRAVLVQYSKGTDRLCDVCVRWYTRLMWGEA